MLALPDVSLLCLDTRHPDLAVQAMRRCLDRAAFGEAVLLTRDGYRSPDPRIRVHAVAPLHSVADNANGVYADAAGTFPTRTWGKSNYFVDAVVR